MSGFDLRWLDLREMADHAARDPDLRARAIDYVQAGEDDRRVMDLGCGSGSTLRALMPDASSWSWRLVDGDAALLNEAKSRHGSQIELTLLQTDLSQLTPAHLGDARLVCASALFDLVPAEFIDRLVSFLPHRPIGLYAALNYDKDCRWDTTHESDAAVVRAFNEHQRTDKGLGPALGPQATAHLAEALHAAGFEVATASSPWRLGPEHETLQERFLTGMAEAVAQTRMLEEHVLAEWLRERLSLIATSPCRVGHQDLFAIR